MALANELLCEVGDHPLGTAVIFGRHTFIQWSYLSDLHILLPSINTEARWALPEMLVELLVHTIGSSPPGLDPPDVGYSPYHLVRACICCMRLLSVFYSVAKSVPACAERSPPVASRPGPCLC